jgi:hypothetical protein
VKKKHFSLGSSFESFFLYGVSFFAGNIIYLLNTDKYKKFISNIFIKKTLGEKRGNWGNPINYIIYKPCDCHNETHYFKQYVNKKKQKIRKKTLIAKERQLYG